MHQWDPLERDFDTKGGWGQTNKVTKNSYFCPIFHFVLVFNFRFIVFHLTNCAHNRFLLAGTFSVSAKTCFYEQNSHPQLAK